MNEAQQVKKCQQTHRSYAYMEQRHKNRDRQLYCKLCHRWKFPALSPGDSGSSEGDLCRRAVTVKPRRCIRCENRRSAKEEALCRRCIAELEAAELEGSGT